MTGLYSKPKISGVFAVVLLCLSIITIPVTAAKSAKTSYRFSPSANTCYASGTKEYKKLSQNRIYKTLTDCQKKIKNKKQQVLGASEKKGGSSTTVSLEIKAK